ncbi:MAG: N-acetylmuramoyl-L-alanine amidase [Lachnospiraceae bacterium]
MAKVVLDAGHGGSNPGAVYKGRREKDDVLRLTLAIGEILRDNGIDVVYTRTDDRFDSPLQKANIANASGADLFVSLHRNSSPMPNQYTGIETLVYEDEGTTAELAKNINNQTKEIGWNDLGVNERKDLIVLRRTNMPSVLVEAGFINTDTDNEKFDQDFSDLANAIATGILDTVNELNALNKQTDTYRVQIGLYRSQNNARYQLNRAMEDGYEGMITPFREFYAVRLGAFDTLDDAVKLERELKMKGYDTLIIMDSEKN